jgi:hypothetical protein
MTGMLDFLVVVLATGAIIDVWHNGSIFALARAKIQAKNDVAPANSFTRLWTELLNCPFCKSYHIPVYLYAILLLADWFGSIVSVIARLVIYGLAATRLSNIIDGILPARMRYDRPIEFGTANNEREN